MMTLQQLRDKALAKLSEMLDNEDATVRLSAAKIALGAKDGTGSGGAAEAADAAMAHRMEPEVETNVVPIHRRRNVGSMDLIKDDTMPADAVELQSANQTVQLSNILAEEVVDAGDAEAEG